MDFRGGLLFFLNLIWNFKGTSIIAKCDFKHQLLPSSPPPPSPTAGALLDPVVEAALEDERASLEEHMSSLVVENQRLEYESTRLGGREELCCVGGAGEARAREHR